MKTRQRKAGTSFRPRPPESWETPKRSRRERSYPVGAEAVARGGVHFRVWAPRSKFVGVRLGNDLIELETTHVELEPEANGYFSGHVPEAEAGLRYKFELDSGVFPDPVSRFQPDGPHGPSQIIDPRQFQWTDANWKGVTRERQAIYEMHIGTFTREGTWEAAIEQLPELARLGITMLEVMPVADFPGRFGWGYDGVNLFAPSRLYGDPDEFRAFVNQAHQLGLGVILDVVYNHVGPDGNYLKQFAEEYFTARYANEWGEALNFDDAKSGPVREFFVTNAAYWIEEFHLDGLRLDATQQIYDASQSHIIAEINRAVREAAKGRGTYIVAENERQESKLVRDSKEAGYGLDALWNDDFHHSARVAVTGRKEAYYTDYQGSPQEFISMAKRGYLYQGQYYSWQKQRRGRPALGLHPNQFVNCIQNHDQVANSLHGIRLHQLTSPGRFKAVTALMLLLPGTPMLFQGQEFAASTPFLYFADHDPELAKLVAVGRRKFLEQFPSVACAESKSFLSDPEAEQTFQRCKLDFSERQRNRHIYELHRDLLQLRRADPVFSNPRIGGLDGAVLGTEAFVIRYFGEQQDDRLLLINFGTDLRLTSVPEPLLAPVEDHEWKLIWSSEDPRYGGCGTPCVETDSGWRIPGHAAVVMATSPKS